MGRGGDGARLHCTTMTTALPVRLTTDCLQLRPWQASDLPAMAQLHADAQAMRYFPATLSRADSDALVARFQASIDAQGWGFWATEHRASGECIGMIGLNRPRDDLPCSPCVEVGWRLRPRYWGQGLATEGARACVDWALTTLGLDEVVAFTALPNTPSQAVMQRLGMRVDPHTFVHPALPAGHALAEHCLYRLSRADWQAAHFQK